MKKPRMKKLFLSLIHHSVVLSLDASQDRSVDADADAEELTSAIADLQSLLLELLGTNGPAWAPIISKWTLSLLGELSSRHASLVAKVKMDSTRAWQCSS